MKSVYDLVFVTHLPAFYKVNLYNMLAKQKRIYVIFIGQSSQIRANDFVGERCQFDHCVLDPAHFEQRNRWKNALRIRTLIQQLHYQQLIVGGWDLPEFWMCVFSSPPEKNALVLESSIFESQAHGWRAWFKQRFLSRIKTVYASGIPHQQLLAALHFQGQVKKTLGVGVFNYQGKRHDSPREFSGKFITVARLAPEKNLQILCQVFAELPQFQLTIVGQGPLYQELTASSPSNVRLLGHVPNTELAKLYQDHDIFILPSTAEPWGLVVEEALYFGLPVLASNRVGCAQDLIEQYQTGLLFDPYDRVSIRQTILQAQLHYDQFKAATNQLDFMARDALQVQQYLGAHP